MGGKSSESKQSPPREAMPQEEETQISIFTEEENKALEDDVQKPEIPDVSDDEAARHLRTRRKAKIIMRSGPWPPEKTKDEWERGFVSSDDDVHNDVLRSVGAVLGSRRGQEGESLNPRLIAHAAAKINKQEWDEKEQEEGGLQKIKAIKRRDDEAAEKPKVDKVELERLLEIFPLKMREEDATEEVIRRAYTDWEEYEEKADERPKP